MVMYEDDWLSINLVQGNNQRFG
ncbi:hypothetical protein Bhyg_12078 [Pseudolycoriella hygida]|uniref:Uncharacterized protein n=1 Tax=Pseudolycoriella hygida TaxID=35572 RepID=A0A9Q0MY06_9DIPT|nr:hypothetical protein Bhyg_12078 [Pseudolycoriella hygida]